MSDCQPFIVPLVIMCMAFVISLTINIVYFVVKDKKAKNVFYYSEGAIGYEPQYIESNPIYGNLNQPMLEHIDDSCYEQMTAPHSSNREGVQLIQAEPEEQMCYAALDLSPKKPRKKKKANQTDLQGCMDDETPMENGNILSESSIYLNSEQLTAESNAEKDLIHDDPKRLYHIIQKSRNNMPSEGT
uniref:T-cell receptor-associated transmembrane adapter 1 n=1 Tax=Xenopus tropicalis TaxID=8364 RepID=A0A803JAJ6_XENTR